MYVPFLLEPITSFVYQLSDEEMRRYNPIDIKHIGAVYDISNLIKKEDTLMIEKLKAYRAELEAKKAAIESEDHTAEIEAKVEDYKATLEKEEAERKAAIVAKILSDIECINNIIAREEETEAVEVTTAVVDGTVLG